MNNRKEQIIENILAKKIIAIIRGMKPDVCLKLAESFLEGGINMIEVTFDQRVPESFQNTVTAIREIREHFAGDVYVGAGTVITKEQLEMAAEEAGAQYIISPNADPDIIRKTVEKGLISIPGAATATEICKAYEDGAHFVKIFPAGSLGTDYIKALQAPLGHIPMLAVGGIGPENIALFLKAGAVGAGVGGILTNKAWIEAGEYKKITDTAKKLIENADGAQN